MNPVSIEINPFSTDALDEKDLLATSDKGRPEVPKGRAVPPWLREKKWRVIPLARGKASLFPPPGGEPVEEFVEENHLVGQGFRVPMVVLGPAGAGLTTFHRWARLRVKKAKVKPVELVELDFARIAQTDDPAEQRVRLASSWHGADTDLARTDLASMIDQLLSNEKLRAHILQRVDRLHLENKEILLGRLRDYAELRSLDGDRFTVLAHETAPLEDAEPFSTFLDVCEVYRLADFTVADVEAMWRDWVPDRADQASDVAQKCIEWTGGQPVLVNLYLGRLFDEADELVNQTGAWLLEHPPRSILQHWQRELARIVGESTLLRRKVSSFLAGEVRESVTREELPLFLAGWIGQDEKGRWAIRSRAHARWAADPLRSPERYRREGDGR